MSISVLIPVFNEDVSILVETLLKQIDTIPNCTVDLILLDDCSETQYHQQLEAYTNLKNVQIHFNEINLGRALVRKKLASLSNKEYLLFLDCDVQMIENNFLKKYVDILETKPAVIVGGTIYLPQKPENPSKILHWKYGTERESIANTGAFKSNNFLINKNIFESIPICDAIKGYGHEDTFIGIWLAENKYQVVTVVNPVYHLGIDDNIYFLEKTENALLNLKELSKIVDGNVLKKHVQLYKYYANLKALKLLAPIKIAYRIFQKAIQKNLLSKTPRIFLLNFYKLALFIKIMEGG